MKDALSDDEIKTSLNRIYDTVFHTAPEIIDQRWVTLYRFCSVYIMDAGNEEHQKCLEIYNTQYSKYKKLLTI